ncbi:NAD(P)H-binding protein [Nocardiopsis oceani]
MTHDSDTGNRNGTKPVLVLGATGMTGSRVARRLREGGHRVRAASRSSDWSFDWQDRSTWDPVLAGTGAVYVVQYDPEPLTPPFVERAAAHGLERVVLLSGRGIDDPDYFPQEFTSEENFVPSHLVGEHAVRDSGLEWTVLRPGWFSQNLSEGVLGDDVRSGQLRLPTDEGSATWIDTEDIAAVAVAALTEPGHHGRTYELSGPRALDLREVSKEISRELARDVAYTPVTAEEFVSERVARGWPEEDARALALALSPIPRGKDAHVSPGVWEALGREPRSFAEFAKDAVSSGVWDR